MAFTLPQFNVLCNTWHFDPVTETYVANLIGQAVQMYVNSREVSDTTFIGFGEAIIFFRFPMGTDVQGSDLIECDPGSGWFYSVDEVEPVHKGFPNEYLVAFSHQLSAGGGVGGFLLAETGDALLTEGSDHIVTENSL